MITWSGGMHNVSLFDRHQRVPREAVFQPDRRPDPVQHGARGDAVLAGALPRPRAIRKRRAAARERQVLEPHGAVEAEPLAVRQERRRFLAMRQRDRRRLLVVRAGVRRVVERVAQRPRVQRAAGAALAERRDDGAVELERQGRRDACGGGGLRGDESAATTTRWSWNDTGSARRARRWGASL